MKSLRTMSSKPLCGIMILAVVAVIALSFSCNSAVNYKSSKVQKDAVSQIGFYETYSWVEVAKAFINLNNEVKKQNLKADEFTLEQLLNTRSHTEDWSRPEYNNPTPVIGHTLVEDTARVNGIIAQYGANFLPQDLKLAWSIKPFSATFDGQYCMSFRFDDKGTQQFSRLTAQNINRHIATVIKGQVYSCPMVMCQVENGNVQVVGNFTAEEIDDLVGFIYGK